jgi:hypothetical protein
LFVEFPCHCPVACTDKHEKQGGRTGKLLKIGLGSHRVNRLIRLEELGLKNVWRKFNRKIPEQCQKFKKATQSRPLTFRNLLSTFVVLIIGIGISILVFVIELLVAHYPWIKRVRFIFRKRENNIMMR